MALNDSTVRPRGASPFSTVVRGILPAFVLAVMAGCNAGEQISHYSIPKEKAIADRHGIKPGEFQPQAVAEPAPTRMLAAIVPHADEDWFFKLTGAPDAVAVQVPAFRTFVASVHFVRSLPKWELPAGWREEPGMAMRFATIRVPAGKQSLELTVVKLPKDTDDDEQYLLDNVNRWRGQVGLPDIAASELPKNVQTLKLKAGEAKLVDFTGQSAGGGMGPFAGARGGPFSGRAPVAESGGLPTGHPPVGREVAPPTGAPTDIAYDVPAGWEKLPASGIAAVSFDVVDAGKHALLTVTPMGPHAGGWLANVNRWRGQIDLSPLNQEELNKQTRHLKVEGQQADYIQLTAPADAESRKAMLAVMIERPDKTWFIKLAGPASVVEHEKARFEAFAGSLRFTTEKSE